MGTTSRPEEGPETTLSSIGHGTRSISDFLALLTEHGIGRLVDVRTAPGSRKHPQFGKDQLASALEETGIEYVWRKDLGGWRKPRPDSPHTALRSPAFRGYADHMDTAEFDAALRWLIDTSRETPTAFMCSETVWWRCHRRLLSDALLAHGRAVVHLMAPGRSDPHRLHPEARLDGTRVIYDRAQPAQEALM